ncbi:Uncharacterized conserved protein, contains tandem ACT domains [Fontimonas thermophila]|uniref:Uncharacterized conserved protein, contains tandem ACT domains n=1 Tax=Fontimonas thermophila TaxID=1076937 RepID=A0A1I2I581_9GAMM|nr:hypothetical protein [Fontimonas thermophila]SFF37442.1 Uncharacterized conserved protein, contains tandem ACT domains [Fontimonas thermophila]
MAKGIRKVNNYVLHANDLPGEGAHLLKTLKKHGVNLLALTAFPAASGTSQVELIPEDSQHLEEIARKYGWKLSKKKTGFLAQGKDRAGALVKLAEKLGRAGINITAIDAIAAGAERYGAVFWVRPKDVDRAAAVIGAR